MRPSDEEDLALVQCARAGQTEAFAELVRRYAGRLSALVYQHVGDPELARDITQNVFLKAYRSLHSLRSLESFSCWLFSIAVREARDFLRSRAREKRWLKEDAGQLASLPASDPQPLEQLLAEEERATVRSALDELPPRQKTVFILRHFHALSTTEVAKTLDISPEAVKASLSYALKALREKLRQS